MNEIRTQGRVFDHNFLPKVDVERVEIDGVRHYRTPQGNFYKSVTTIIGEKKGTKALDAWRKRVGEAEADKVSMLAARRGTAVHDLAEKYLLNDMFWHVGAMPANVETFNTAKNILDEHIGTIFGIEHFLYSDTLKTAGATDLIAEYDGVTSIVDFKTSKTNKTEDMIQSYFVQATCYAMMVEEVFAIAVPQIVIIMLSDDSPQAIVVKRDKSAYIEAVKEIFIDSTGS